MDKPAARLYASYYVCSDHFTVHDFMDPGRTRLTKTAVPNVRPLEHCQSVICRDLVEASTSHSTPSDSQPVTLSRAAHDLAEASTWHGTPSYSQLVTLSRAAPDLVQASASHGAPSDLSPVTPFSSASSESAEACLGGKHQPIKARSLLFAAHDKCFQGLGGKHQPIKARSLLFAAHGKCFQVSTAHKPAGASSFSFKEVPGKAVGERSMVGLGEGSRRVYRWDGMTGAHSNWSSLHGVNGHWGSLDDDRVRAFDGGGEEWSVGWGRGLGAWFVGLDDRVKAGGVSHVLHETANTERIGVAVGADLVVELISGLLTGHAGAELVDVVEAEAVGLGWLL
ncbi:hypothetical protein ISCGN_017328 [Ixodes scapularis]